MAWKCQMCSESLWWLISIRWDNVRASVAACKDLEIWRREAKTKFEMWRIWKLWREKDNNTKTYKNTPTQLCVVWMTWKWWREKAAEQIPAEENNWQRRKLAACASKLSATALKLKLSTSELTECIESALIGSACSLAPPSISRLICQGGVAGATFAFSVHSQIFHPRLQVDNGRRGNRLTACGHATSRAKCSLEVASFNLWTRISCHTEGMSRWWK